MTSSTTTLPASTDGAAATSHGNAASQRDRTHDVIGIGFGPSNLSLAIAIEEHNVASPAQAISALCIESSEAFGWARRDAPPGHHDAGQLPQRSRDDALTP